MDRYWSKVEKTSEDGCWLWKGTSTRDGYGCLHDKNIRVKHKAHRVAWILATGENIESPFVYICHSCGVKRCCNPAHLFSSPTRKGKVHHRRDVVERFWEKVQKAGDTECWLWQAARNQAGYGEFNYKKIKTVDGYSVGKNAPAHRVAWMLTHGDIDDAPGMCVCHHCDNPPCCNPSHLFLGTREDNNKDAARKGRLHASRCVGEANAWAKLSDVEVRAIEVLIRKGAQQRQLAETFGVSPSIISLIVNGKSWKHVTGEN